MKTLIFGGIAKIQTQKCNDTGTKMSHLSFYLFVTNVIGLVTFFLASNLSILQIPTRRNDLFVQSKKGKKGQKKRPEKASRSSSNVHA